MSVLLTFSLADVPKPCPMHRVTQAATLFLGLRPGECPRTKQRVFLVAVKRYGEDNLKSKLAKWKPNVEKPAPKTSSVGAYLERQGHLQNSTSSDLSFSEPTAVTIPAVKGLHRTGAR